MITTKICASLTKVFPDAEPADVSKAVFTMLRNEDFSFQIAFRSDEITEQVRLEIDDPNVRWYRVENVPVLKPYPVKTDAFYERTECGLYPDVLRPGKNGDVVSALPVWQSIWVQIHPTEPLSVGEYPIAVRFFDVAHSLRFTETVTVQVLDVLLPTQTLPVTNWFHCDCIADWYRVPIFSEAFWPYFRSFARLAAENGQNMILLPAFTPPLDTEIGGERMTAQLVSVKKTADGWTFDFSQMARYMAEAEACGIRLFEHSHLFTQWGAYNAPKVEVEIDGETVKYFGWQTDAQAPEYIGFLRAYLTELRQFLAETGRSDRIFFHISDEPVESMLESYGNAKKALADLLEGFPCGDAMHEKIFCEKGLVDIPIVQIDYAADFQGVAEQVWGYYIGFHSYDGYPNRLISNTSARNRILGAELFAADLKGFLHWGFNFYYTQLSRARFNPFLRPDANGDFAAGTSFLVYPGEVGAIPSLRLFVFGEGMQDYRALTLLAEKIGRTETVRWMETLLPAPITFHSCTDAQTLLRFRDALNRKLAEA